MLKKFAVSGVSSRFVLSLVLGGIMSSLSGCAGRQAPLQAKVEARSVSSWDSQIANLFELDHRDSALHALLDRAKSERTPHSGEDLRIGQVVLAPRSGGPPLVVVFVTRQGSPAPAPQSGQFMIFETTGEMLQFPGKNDWLAGSLEDLTGDGTLEIVDISHSRLSGMHTLNVIPLLPPFKSSLQIAWLGSGHDYRVVRSDSSALAVLQLFRRELEQERVLAEYRWDKEQETWSGPGGSHEQGFIRIKNDPSEALVTLVGSSSCLATLQEHIQRLPVIERELNKVHSGARWSGVVRPAAPREIHVSLGVVENNEFESKFEAKIVQGKVIVSDLSGRLEVASAIRKPIEAACELDAGEAYPRLAPPQDGPFFAKSSLAESNRR